MDGIAREIMYSLICFSVFPEYDNIMWRYIGDVIARSICMRQTHSRLKFIVNLYFNCKFLSKFEFYKQRRQNKRGTRKIISRYFFDYLFNT